MTVSGRRIVTLKPVDPAGPGLRLTRIGDDKLTGGVGGWESRPRPGRRPATLWPGLPEQTLMLPLMLDGANRGGRGRHMEVESGCRLLLEWAAASDETGLPMVLTVLGRTTAPAGSRWVLQAIEWGERLRGHRSGRRFMQKLDITLLRFASTEVIGDPAARARDRAREASGEKWQPGTASGEQWMRPVGVGEPLLP